LGEIEHLVGGFACSSSGELHARFGIDILEPLFGASVLLISDCDIAQSR
jgi:hypothetical protein